MDPPPNDFTIKFSDLDFKETISGGGRFADVCRVVYNRSSDNTEVHAAAKKIECADTIEVNVMKAIKHLNIIELYGVAEVKVEHSRMCGAHSFLVMELAKKGDLRNYLDVWRSRKRSKLPLELVWKWCHDGASGLAYLHKTSYTHRDIKSRNFLVMEDFTIKLGDFGVAKRMHGTKTTTTGDVGTCRWMAPEVLNDHLRSFGADAFAFGMVIWEVITTEVPFEDIKGDYKVMNAIVAGKRPAIPDDCPEELTNLINSCWEHNYKKRPAMEDIRKQLEKGMKKKKFTKKVQKEVDLPGVVDYTEQCNGTGTSASSDMTDMLTNKDMTDVTTKAKLMNDDFHDLYRQLNIASDGIEDAERRANTTSVKHKALAVLKFWRNLHGKCATRQALLHALYECKLVRAKEILEEMWTDAQEEVRQAGQRKVSERRKRLKRPSAKAIDSLPFKRPRNQNSPRKTKQR